MFGADGERILALREQQKAQYLADLQHQIAEKARRPKSPSPYSTSMQDATSSHQLSHTVNLGTVLNSNNNANSNYNIISNIKMGSNANPSTTIDRNFNNLKQVSVINSRNQHYDYTPTTIGAINIPINSKNTALKYQALLPMNINSSNKVDVSKFDRRVQEIANNLSIQQNTINDLFDDESTIDQTIQNIQNMMLQVKSITNEKSSTEIPFKTSQIVKSLKDYKQIIGSQNLTFDSEINNIRDKYSTTSNSFSAFTSKFSEQLNDIKQQLNSIKTDENRLNSNFKKSTTKITSIEQKDKSIIEKIQQTNDEFSSFDQSLIQNFNSLNSNVSSMMMQCSQMLANEIKKESGYRNFVNQKLYEQVLLLRNRIQTIFNQIIDKNKELSNTFNNSIESLKNSISSSANENESQIDKLINDENDRIDQLISQTETEFRSITENISLTTNESKKNAKEAFNLIEETLQIEASVNKRNMEEIMAKYDHFDNAMKEELKIKQTAIDRTFSELEKSEIKNFDDSMSPLKTEKSIIQNTIDSIDLFESDIKNLESTINTANYQLDGSVQQLEEIFVKIKDDFELKKLEIHKNLSDIERRIALLESKKVDPDRVLVGDIYLINKKFESDEESKIIELEKQINVALHALADLMGGRPPSLHTTFDQLQIESTTEDESEINEAKTEREDEEENKKIEKQEEEEEEEDKKEKEKIEEEEEQNDDDDNKDSEKVEEEEEVPEEEEDKLEKRKKTEPIKIHVGEVEIGNIGKLDSPNDSKNKEIGKNLAFNPDDFGFTLSSSNKNTQNQKNKEKQNEDKNKSSSDEDSKKEQSDEEDDEEEEEERRDHNQSQNYNHYDYEKIRPVC